MLGESAQSVFPFLLDLALRSTVLAGVALGVSLLVRWRASMRASILQATVAGLCLLPLSFLVEGPYKLSLPIHLPAISGGGPSTGSHVRISAYNRVTTQDVDAKATQGQSLLPLLIVLVYASGFFILAIHGVLSILSLRILRKTSASVSSGRMRSRFIEMRSRIVPRSPVSLLVNEQVAGPCVTGVFRPAVILPSSQQPTNTELTVIFAHELIHVKRCDCLFRYMSLFLRIVFWPHPLVWRIISLLERTQDQACDEAASAILGDRNAYARTLLDLLYQSRFGHAPDLVQSMAHPTGISERINRLNRPGELFLDGTDRGTRAFAAILCLAIATWTLGVESRASIAIARSLDTAERPFGQPVYFPSPIPTTVVPLERTHRPTASFSLHRNPLAASFSRPNLTIPMAHQAGPNAQDDETIPTPSLLKEGAESQDLGLGNGPERNQNSTEGEIIDAAGAISPLESFRLPSSSISTADLMLWPSPDRYWDFDGFQVPLKGDSPSSGYTQLITNTWMATLIEINSQARGENDPDDIDG